MDAGGLDGQNYLKRLKVRDQYHNVKREIAKEGGSRKCSVTRQDGRPGRLVTSKGE